MIGKLVSALRDIRRNPGRVEHLVKRVEKLEQVGLVSALSPDAPKNSHEISPTV